MIDDVDVRDGPGESRPVAQIANRDLYTGHRRLPGGITLESTNLTATCGERARQVAAGESRCAGYEDAHRSVTSVTGDPRRPSKPTRPRTPSTAVVNRRDPIAL